MQWCRSRLVGERAFDFASNDRIIFVGKVFA
jgi:hypothetical protein